MEFVSKALTPERHVSNQSVIFLPELNNYLRKNPEETGTEVGSVHGCRCVTILSVLFHFVSFCSFLHCDNPFFPVKGNYISERYESISTLELSNAS